MRIGVALGAISAALCACTASSTPTITSRAVVSIAPYVEAPCLDVRACGATPDGGLRSYGSMTYAGLKSMIYCGAGPEDPRVKAATKWIKDHYTLAENPGMGQQGLYYYYQTMSKALAAANIEVQPR